MDLGNDHIACEHCAHVFRRRPLGRRPLYCSRTCRQRAYEARRRGAEHLRRPTAALAFPRPQPLPSPAGRTLHPAPAPDRADPTDPRPPQGRAARRTGPRTYEPGHGKGVTHALRPDGPPSPRGHRPTLCGTTGVPLRVDRGFADGPHILRPCRTCTTIATRFPLAAPVEAAAELARIKHLLADARRRVRHRQAHAARAVLLAQLYRLTSAS